MTEREWLIQKSGLTAEQVTAMEAVAGADKFTTMLKGIIADNEAATAAKAAAAQEKADAEKTRLDFEKRYSDEYQPQMTQLAKDNLAATERAAAAEAKLAKMKEWGLYKDDEPPKKEDAPPRAPGSDPNVVSRDDFGRFSQSQSNTIIALNDLNAEHFKLFGSPLGQTQALVDEVQKQRTLGNRGYTLRDAWEAKYNVAQKREENAKAEQQKHDDQIRADERKKIAEANGGNPGLVSGKPSRFSSMTKSNDASAQPWKSSRFANERNQNWRKVATEKFRDAAVR